MLRIDERLGLAVAALLVDIGFDRVAAEMPDDRRRAEADRVAGILKPPADVDIVAGGAIDRVEPAEAEQGLAAERHVAAGDVLGHLVAEQHVGRAARRHRDRGRDEAVLGRREIRSAAGAEPARFHPGDEIGQPVGVGDAIAVGIGDDLAGRRLGADIAGDAQALVRLADDPAIGIALGDFEGAVARAVIDDDDLVIGIVEHLERGEARHPSCARHYRRRPRPRPAGNAAAAAAAGPHRRARPRRAPVSAAARGRRGRTPSPRSGGRR